MADAPTTAVLFDIDGTLVDSNYAHVDAWWRAFRVVGASVDAWHIHRLIGMDSTRLLEGCCPTRRKTTATPRSSTSRRTSPSTCRACACCPGTCAPAGCGGARAPGGARHECPAERARTAAGAARRRAVGRRRHQRRGRRAGGAGTGHRAGRPRAVRGRPVARRDGRRRDVGRRDRRQGGCRVHRGDAGGIGGDELRGAGAAVVSTTRRRCWRASTTGRSGPSHADPRASGPRADCRS